MLNAGGTAGAASIYNVAASYLAGITATAVNAGASATGLVATAASNAAATASKVSINIAAATSIAATARVSQGSCSHRLELVSAATGGVACIFGYLLI